MASRRRFLGYAAGAAAVAGLPRLGRSDAGEPARRTSAIVFLTDDMHDDWHGLVSVDVHTPNLNRFARDGVWFDRAYITSPVCTPCRYTLFTAQFAGRAESLTYDRPEDLHHARLGSNGQRVIQWNTRVTPDVPSLARAYQAAGYKTGIVGKCDGYFVPRETSVPGGDPRHPDVARQLQANQQQLGDFMRSCGFDFAERLYHFNLDRLGIDELKVHNFDWIIGGALQFLRERAADNEPFLLFVALTGPHMPDPTASMIADPDRRRTPAGLLPADSPRVLPDNADVLRRVREAGAREELAGITWLDDALAAVLDAVDDHGLADDTLIAYVIDHNDVGGKGSLYDAGARTKMALRGPGVSGRGRTNSLVANVDLPATLLDWCGIDPADTNMTIDGVSLRPILREPTSAVRDDLYLEIGLTRGLVTADGWKYIALRKPPEWQCETKGHLGLPEIYHMEGYTISHHPVHYFDADQLYDLNADPQERRNLARDRHATPANRARLAAMQARLREMLQPVPGPFGEFKEGA